MTTHYHQCSECPTVTACPMDCAHEPDQGTIHGLPFGDSHPCAACFAAAHVYLRADVLATITAERDAFRAALAGLVATLPRCDACHEAPATRAYARGGTRYCDAHARMGPSDPDATIWGPSPPDYPCAPALRAAVALLRGTP